MVWNIHPFRREKKQPYSIHKGYKYGIFIPPAMDKGALLPTIEFWRPPTE